MKLSLAVAAAMLVYGGRAQASAITYTEQATASGSLGGTAFTNALVTLTLVGDTSNVTGTTFLTNSVGTFTLNVSGLGGGTFTDALWVFDNQTFSPPAAGFGLTAGGSILDTFDNAFGAYGLVTPIGPITDSPFINSGESFDTTAGAFIINSSGNSTFTASTGSVPEPVSVTLMGVGLLGLVGFGIAKRR